MKRNSHLPLALFALAGTTLALTACNPSGSGAAAPPHSAPAVKAAATAKPSATHPVRPSNSPSRPAVSASATSHPVASSPSASRPAPGVPSPKPSVSSVSPTLTRVSADCGALSARPSGIVIACADHGLGVEGLTWNNWGTTTATGQGTLYENECTPTASCGEAQFSKYPVKVTLSDVKSSSGGPYFSELSVTWEAGRPSNATPNSFTLEGPAS